MAKGWSVSGVSACIPQCSIPNSIYMIVLNVLQPHLAVQCDCSPFPSFLSPLLPFSSPPSAFTLYSLELYSFFLYIAFVIMVSHSHNNLLLVASIFAVGVTYL